MTVNTPFQTITHTNGNPINVDLSGNGKFLVVVDTSGDLYLYDIENNRFSLLLILLSFSYYYIITKEIYGK